MKNLESFLFAIVSIVFGLLAFGVVLWIAYVYYALSMVSAVTIGAVVGFAVAFSGYVGDYLPRGALYFALSAKKIARNANPKNIAGFKDTHYYAFKEDIDTWPVALTPDFLSATAFGELVTIPDTDPFVMKTGKYFHPIPCTLEEGKVGSVLTGPTESKCFENSANFSNAGNNDALRGFLAYTANKPVVLIMRELNGTMKVVGTEGYMAQLDTAEAANGGKASDGNTQKHSYKAYAEIPCATYAADVPLDATEL